MIKIKISTCENTYHNSPGIIRERTAKDWPCVWSLDQMGLKEVDELEWQRLHHRHCISVRE
jgi:hypothetical protein